MTERFIAFKKDGVIDRKIGFVHESCFSRVEFNTFSEEGANITAYRAPTDAEAIAQFEREGYETIILSENEVKIENTRYFLIDKQNLLIKNRQKYLSDTDWYIVREFETGKATPEHIQEFRAQAREDIENIKRSTKIEELDNFNLMVFNL